MMLTANEEQKTMSSSEMIYNTQNSNKKFLLKSQSCEPMGEEHESEIFGNKSKSEFEEMNDYSYKPTNSTNSEDLFLDKRENETKKSVNVSPGDVEEDYLPFAAKVESRAFNSVLKQAGFKNTVSAEKILEVKKSAIETKFINSVSEMKEIDCDIDEFLLENTDSTNVIEESLSKREDTESSNNSDVLYGVGDPHSAEIYPVKKLEENSGFVPINEKVLVEPNMYDKLLIKTKTADKKKNTSSVTSFDSEISSVKYNLRNKRTEKEPKPRQNVTQKTAPSKATNKKVPNKRNVRKTKQNTQPKKGQAKQKKNTKSSFETSSPLMTPIKRLISHESELNTIERQKKPKTWDDLEKEIQPDRQESERGVPLHGMASRGNTCFTISRDEKSTTSSSKTTRSVQHFSGYAFGFGASGKTSDLEMDKFSLFQARAASQAPKETQPNQSQAIVERTLAAMQKCKVDYMRQIEVSEDNFEDGSSLKNNLTRERSLESEDQNSDNYPYMKATSPEENFVPLYLTRSTKFSYANSTIGKKNTTNTLRIIDSTDKRKRITSTKINSNFCLEDSGFQDSFFGNDLKPIRNDVNSGSENPWEKFEKRMKLCEWKLDQLCEEKVNNLCTKRPIVHYLTKASTSSEKNIRNLAAGKDHYNSIEITSENSVCNQRQKKNIKVPTLDLKSKNVRSEIYLNRVSSEEYHNDAILSEEDVPKLKLKNQDKYSAPEPKCNDSDIQENLEDGDQMMMTDNDHQNKYCTSLKIPSPNTPSNECHNNKTALLATTGDRNVKFNQIEDESGCESEEKHSIDDIAIHSKANNSAKYNKEESPKENLDGVRQIKLERKQRTYAFRKKESLERVTEGVGREYKKTQKRSAKDDAFNDLLSSSESKRISTNKTVNTYNTRRKYIPTIDLSSDSENDNQKKGVALQRNAKSKQSKEKYQRYIGKILQQNSETGGASQAGVTERGLIKDSRMLAQSADDLFSISSSDSDTNLKGVGLLCDILDEEE